MATEKTKNKKKVTKLDRGEYNKLFKFFRYKHHIYRVQYGCQNNIFLKQVGGFNIITKLNGTHISQQEETNIVK